MIEVVIAGAGPNGLMLAGELGLTGIRPVVLDPLPGPNPQPRANGANGIVGQGVRILDRRGLYGPLAGTTGPPRRAPRSMFAAFPLDFASTPDSQVLMASLQRSPDRCPRNFPAVTPWGRRRGGRSVTQGSTACDGQAKLVTAHTQKWSSRLLYAAISAAPETVGVLPYGGG